MVHCAPVGGSRRMRVMVYGSTATGCVEKWLLGEGDKVGKTESA